MHNDAQLYGCKDVVQLQDNRDAVTGWVGAEGNFHQVPDDVQYAAQWAAADDLLEEVRDLVEFQLVPYQNLDLNIKQEVKFDRDVNVQELAILHDHYAIYGQFDQMIDEVIDNLDGRYGGLGARSTSHRQQGRQQQHRQGRSLSEGSHHGRGNADRSGVYWSITVIKTATTECVSGPADSAERDRGNGRLRMSVKICTSTGCSYTLPSCHPAGRSGA